jgi:hypothetical protein
MVGETIGTDFNASVLEFFANITKMFNVLNLCNI